MSYYKTCPRCGAHLDPGEVCDCLDAEARMLIDHVKKAPASVGSTDEDMADTSDQTISASHDIRETEDLQA